MNLGSGITHHWQRFVCMFAFSLVPTNAFSDASTICLDKILEAGFEVPSRSVEVSVLSNGLVRYNWSSAEVACETIEDQIINLTVKGKKILENGFSSPGAEALFKYMQNENSDMFADCKARFDGTKETFTNIYLPKLQSLSADVEEIKKQFDENFSRVSREFFIKKYYEHRKRLARLETYEELLRNDATNSEDITECVTVADKALAREIEFKKQIEKLETQILQRNDEIRQQSIEIVKLREEVQKLKGDRASLSAELALYEKPRKLNAIVDELNNADFVKANQLYEEISSKFTLTFKEKKRLETAATQSVRPIPASDRVNNRDGYQFLVNLFPDNKYYQNKLVSYSD